MALVLMFHKQVELRLNLKVAIFFVILFQVISLLITH